MSLESQYATLRLVHIGAVIGSGGLFAARALAGLLGWKHALHPALRYLSYAIDFVLLSAAVSLAYVLAVVPVMSGWLTVKVLLLLVYIVLGSVALKRGKTRASRARALVAAVVVYLFIASVALSHDPRGVVAILGW